MAHSASRRVGLLCVLLLVGCATQASAVPVFFGWGDKMYELAPVPEDSILGLGMAIEGESIGDWHVGYYCKQISMFWCPIWTWSGSFCIYNSGNDTYEPFPSIELAALATGLPESTFKRPFGAKVPFGLLIILAFIGIKIALAARSGKAAPGPTPVAAPGMPATPAARPQPTQAYAPPPVPVQPQAPGDMASLDGPPPMEGSAAPAAPDAIRFACQQCGKELTVPANMAGQQGKCAGCGASVTAPPA